MPLSPRLANVAWLPELWSRRWLAGGLQLDVAQQLFRSGQIRRQVAQVRPACGVERQRLY